LKKKMQSHLKTLADTGNSASDLTGDKGRASARRLVIEKDAVGQVHTIGFTIVYDHPVCILKKYK
jgi:hypothetical protein